MNSTTELLSDNNQVCCVCGKSLSAFDSVRRLQHTNRCLDEQEQNSKFKRKKDAYESTIDCPMCKANLHPGPFRIAHLKKCCIENKIPLSNVLELIKTQERIVEIRKAKNLPHTSAKQPTLEMCLPKRRKNCFLPKSIEAENVQLAMSLSKSEREKMPEEHDMISCSFKCTAKDRPLTNTALALETYSDESRMETLQGRLSAIISAQVKHAEKDTLSFTSKNSKWWKMHSRSDLLDCGLTDFGCDKMEHVVEQTCPSQDKTFENASILSLRDDTSDLQHEPGPSKLSVHCQKITRSPTPDLFWNDDKNEGIDTACVSSVTSENSPTLNSITLDVNKIHDLQQPGDYELPLFERIRQRMKSDATCNSVAPFSNPDRDFSMHNEDDTGDGSVTFESKPVVQNFIESHTLDAAVATINNVSTSPFVDDQIFCNESPMCSSAFTILKKTDVTPMPAFSSFGTPQLTNELEKYGVKPMARRRAVPFLQKLFDETHPYISDNGLILIPENCKKENAKVRKPKRLSSSQPTSTSDTRRFHNDYQQPKKNAKRPANNNSKRISLSQRDCSSQEGENSDSGEFDYELKSPIAEESFLPDVGDDADEEKNVEEELRKFFLSDDMIYKKILTYEPLPLKETHAAAKSAGVKCSLKTFTDFLDNQCVTFTLKDERKNPGIHFKPRRKN